MGKWPGGIIGRLWYCAAVTNQLEACLVESDASEGYDFSKV